MARPRPTTGAHEGLGRRLRRSTVGRVLAVPVLALAMLGVGVLPAQAVPTATFVDTSPNPSLPGEPVTLIATVPPVDGDVPTGTVVFSYDGSFLFVPLDASGNAVTTVFDLPPGSTTVTAEYGGDVFFDPSSAAVTHVVLPVSTTTTVSASPNPSIAGELVDVCAAVTPDLGGSGTPTGVVTFTGPGGLNQSVTLDGFGEGCVQSTTLESGVITASYAGDGGFDASSGTVAVTVDPASTTTTTVVAPDPSVTGETVSVCATVAVDAPGTGPATGTVTFTGPGGLAETVPLDPAGVACLTTAVLTTGTVTATYDGAPGLESSTGTFAVTVESASTATTVTASPDPSLTGESVQVCATVAVQAPGTGIPTGSVTFTGANGPAETIALDTTGAACLTSTTLESGTITATYDGDGAFAPSSGTAGVTVLPGSTTTTTVVAPDPSVTGEPVSVCATVTVDPPASAVPTGTVTFSGPAGLDETVALDPSGVACFVTADLASGTITATYNGAVGLEPSAGTVPVTVLPAPTSTVVVASPDPAVTGELVTVCAAVTVEEPGSGTAAGVVTFAGAGLDTSVLLDAAGEACVDAADLTSGTITATYTGSPLLATSAGTTELTVLAAATATTLTASPNPAVVGQDVEVCAAVDVQEPGSGTPTGDVVFTSSGDLEATVPLDAAGVACVVVTAETSGFLFAAYAGGAGYVGSSATTVLSVLPGATTTLVVAVPNPSVTGQDVEVCASVTVDAPASGTVTGTVTFTGPGGLNQTAAVDAAGVACITTALLTSGTVVATYSGSGGFATSAGATEVTVADAATVTSVEATPNPSQVGETVTLAIGVDVVAPGTGVPAGTVELSLDGVPFDELLLEDGVVVVELTDLVPGERTVAVAYTGGDGYAPSAATVVLVVGAAATTTVVGSSDATSTASQPVTLTATVSGEEGTTVAPTGTVTFRTGDLVLGTAELADAEPGVGASTATLALAGLPVGTWPVTAEYAGDERFTGSASAAGTLVQEVVPDTTTVVVDPVPPVTAGQSVTLRAVVTTVAPGTAVPTGTVTFLADGVALGAPVTLVNGVALLTTTLGAGQRAITATFTPTGAFTASSTPAPVVAVVAVAPAAAAPTGGSGNLAATGADAGALGALSAVTVAMGLALLAADRRRRLVRPPVR